MVVVTKVFVPGILRYELQKAVAGGPRFLKTLRAPVIFAQVGWVRSSRYGPVVGSGCAAAKPTQAMREKVRETMTVKVDKKDK